MENGFVFFACRTSRPALENSLKRGDIELIACALLLMAITLENLEKPFLGSHSIPLMFQIARSKFLPPGAPSFSQSK
jgi:hypothetical protein